MAIGPTEIIKPPSPEPGVVGGIIGFVGAVGADGTVEIVEVVRVVEIVEVVVVIVVVWTVETCGVDSLAAEVSVIPSVVGIAGVIRRLSGTGRTSSFSGTYG